MCIFNHDRQKKISILKEYIIYFRNLTKYNYASLKSGFRSENFENCDHHRLVLRCMFREKEASNNNFVYEKNIYCNLRGRLMSMLHIITCRMLKKYNFVYFVKKLLCCTFVILCPLFRLWSMMYTMLLLTVNLIICSFWNLKCIYESFSRIGLFCFARFALLWFFCLIHSKNVNFIHMSPLEICLRIVFMPVLIFLLMHLQWPDVCCVENRRCLPNF